MPYTSQIWHTFYNMVPSPTLKSTLFCKHERFKFVGFSECILGGGGVQGQGRGRAAVNE